ncbi:potassium voltage-gated channel subfamily C member 1-like [Haliotis rufescens]|uniref:potassium voltage-gated channel subfamily C member 1-like n=1 Tax=Haliotis rufescens TaxID=6454 RepID=UPI001EAFDE2D|nr:potassium voltage-gated channel subfamily C member 1-like [Haliotis rufescens]
MEPGSRSQSLAPKLSLAPGRSGNNRVVINVGGIRYETYKTTLKSIPDTRLSWLTETTAQNPDYDKASGEYFFDRHPGVFNMILNYYRTGRLHAPTDVCGPLFEEELAFWGIDEKQIEPCCWSNYRAHRDAQETLAEFDDGVGDDGEMDVEDEDEIAKRFGIVEKKIDKPFWERWQPRIWSLLEDPKSSTGAKVIALISVVFVLLSISVFCMETHIIFRHPRNSSVEGGTTVREIQRLTQPLLFLSVIEYTCITYFTIEIIIRFLFCPSKISHLKHVLNWVDFTSVIPFYTKIIVVAIDPSLEDSTGLYFLNSLRLIRIFRILKLTRHVSGLKILAQTIKASAKELLLLILVLSIGVLIFSCLIFYAEQVEESSRNDFRDIPIAFWWAVVTMTTLGYGDMYPRTGLGYIVGAICALCGLLMLALPVPVIVNNFTLYYSHAQARMKLPKKTKNFLVGAADALKQHDSRVSLESGESNPERSSSSDILKNLHDKVDRKGSDNSEESTDSGIKTVSNSGEMSGISVIFTDEMTYPQLPRVRTPPSVKRKKSQPRRQSPTTNGGGSTRRGSMTLKNNGTSRRRSLFPTMADVDV